MKIAIASQNRKEVTPHAGQCRRFWVLELAAGMPIKRDLVELDRDQTFHEGAHGAAHPLDGIDVLIAGGMGPGLRRRLAEKSIRTIVTGETDIDRVVASFLGGTLVDTPAVADTEGHDHGPGHGAGGCGSCGCSH